MESILYTKRLFLIEMTNFVSLGILDERPRFEDIKGIYERRPRLVKFAGSHALLPCDVADFAILPSQSLLAGHSFIHLLNVI